MKILADCHIHTINSFDAESSLQEICESAIEKGINYIAVTDHMETPEIPLGAKSQYGDMVNQIKQSVSDVDICREIYKDKIIILKGIELGEPMHDLECTKIAMDIADFDFVLASVHNLQNYEDFYFLEYNENNIPQLLTLYFEELLDTAKNADFDSLAHLTYPLRYIVERTDIRPELAEYKELIDEIFMTIIKRDKALEINTSGLFKPIGTTLPDIDLVKRFKELGGKYVTLGSDSHIAENVGAGIEQGIDILKNSGFSHFTVFEKRVPKLIGI